MEITKEGVDNIIAVLGRSLERLKGCGMPELDIEVRELIIDLKYFRDDSGKVPAKKKK